MESFVPLPPIGECIANYTAAYKGDEEHIFNMSNETALVPSCGVLPKPSRKVTFCAD